MVALPQDSEWLEAFRLGDRQALERVYRIYVRGIERYLRALGRTSLVPELAQSTAIADLLQEVFVRAFSPTARRNYDGVRDYGAYLTTIARNCFVDALRAHGRQVLHAQEEWLLQVDQDGEFSDDGLDPRVRAVLDRYVAELPSHLKQVYESRFERGESQHDSSAKLQISLEKRTADSGESPAPRPA
jgi:RNA polymerase sigma factor (sigma-70 family)